MISLLLIFLSTLVWWYGNWGSFRLKDTKQSPLRRLGRKSLSTSEDGANSSNNLDKVYPVHFIDQSNIVRTSLISYTFRYDVVLDAQRLHDSLAMLLASGDWRKLGGRLRQNKNGNLEIHVPTHFSSERPPFRFSHVKFNMNMDEHTLANRLPKKTKGRPSIQEGCKRFFEFSMPSDLPNNIEHYLSSDEPLICLHINSFANGTLVSLTFPHSLADAMGTANFIQAWSYVCREQNVDSLELHLEGATSDIIASVGTDDDLTAKDTKFVLEDRQTRRASLVAFIARFTFDMLTRRNIEMHHIYLPANFLSHLRGQVVRDWGLTHRDQDSSAPFISDGDLITSWGSRMVLSSATRKGSAAICNVFDMRKRLEIFNAKKALRGAAYLQNLILPSVTLLTAEEASNLSISQIALRVRKSLVEQTTDAQVRSLMRLARVWFSSLGTMPLFVSWDTTRVIAITNWSKAQFLDHAAFAPAATKCNVQTCGQSVKPAAYWGTTLAVTDSPRDTFIVYGKDDDGAYWVHGYLRHETWKLIQTEFDNFAK